MLLKALTGNLTFKSLKPPDLTCCTKRQLREYFENSYDLNESLFTSLRGLTDDGVGWFDAVAANSVDGPRPLHFRYGGYESVFYKCPDRLRLPLIFYYCHTAVVYVNKLLLAGLIKERVNYEFEVMFETGVDEMSWDDTENYRMGGSYQWPSLEEVVNYRRQVKNLILDVIQDTPLELPITMDSPWWALLMGMEHERVHVETSSVLIRQLPVDMVTRPDGWVYGPMKYGESVINNPLVKVDGRTVTFGKPKDFASYGWDNEYGEWTENVPDFEASKYLVTNRQYLEFINAGGYNNKEFWSAEGWQWKTFRQSSHPVFWVCDSGCKSGCGGDISQHSHCHFPETVVNGNIHTNGLTNGIVKEQGKYRYRAMFDVIALPLDWPVDVNYHEARAFCAWKGSDYRLLTEAEHVLIRGPEPLTTSTKCDIVFREDTGSNMDLQFGSSTPVNMHQPTPLGFHDVHGNIWEWTEDHFNGLDGFDSHFLYDDFSSPCFDGRHNLIMGGSWVSTGCTASRFSRYAFRRHFIQHAGFRIARTLSNDNLKKVPARYINADIFVLGVGEQDIPLNLDPSHYEVKYVTTKNPQYDFDSKRALEGILDLEFGYRDSFPDVVTNLCLSYTRTYKSGNKSAVWFGSGAGKGPLLLSQGFQQILGVDFGGRFIDTAMQLQQGRKMTFIRPDGNQATAAMETDLNASNVTFKQFTWIPNEVGKHNLVVITFLERTLNPKAWLARLWDITDQKGLLVIASMDGTWNRDSLLPHLGDRFKCICIQEVPFNGPTTAVAMVTVWVHKY